MLGNQNVAFAESPKQFVEQFVALSLADRRFRWVFIRALIRQRRAGKINAAQYRRFKAAAWSGMPIAGSGKGEPDGLFIHHLLVEIKKRKGREANGLFDIFDGLLDGGVDGIFTWLLENWQLVLQIIMGLLVFLEAEENA